MYRQMYSSVDEKLFILFYNTFLDVLTVENPLFLLNF